jgi:hypothetical protein
MWAFCVVLLLGLLRVALLDSWESPLLYVGSTKPSVAAGLLRRFTVTNCT